MQIFLTSINIFLKHPFLGIGWGSHFADFFSSLLANTGIFGFLSFLSIFIFMIAKTLKSKDETIYNLMNLGLLGLFLTGIIWNGININILWIILGIWGREVIFKKCLSFQ
jgi:O-antigen ligase